MTACPVASPSPKWSLGIGLGTGGGDAAVALTIDAITPVSTWPNPRT
jgi:hypothetical protein